MQRHTEIQIQKRSRLCRERLLFPVFLTVLAVSANGHAQTRPAVPSQGPVQKGPSANADEALAQTKAERTAMATCSNALLHLPAPQNFIVTPGPSNTPAGIATFSWTPVPGMDPSDSYSLTYQVDGEGPAQFFAGVPYNQRSYTASNLLAVFPLRFAIAISKSVSYQWQTIRGIEKATTTCTGAPAAFGNLVSLESTAPPYVVGTVPADPQLPTIPPNDDIILYVHGGPDSRLEEAGDLVNPLLDAGRIRGKGYTIISFDQPSQGYSSKLDPLRLVPPPPPVQIDGTVPNLGAGFYYPLVGFSENFIVAFMKALDNRIPSLRLSQRNVYIVGGSLGGMLTLRLGHRPEPWIKKIVSWNPASVWSSYADDETIDVPALSGLQIPLKAATALSTGYARSLVGEDQNTALGPFPLDGTRQGYFNSTFGPLVHEKVSPVGLTIFNLNIQPNPEEWYRGDRDKYPGNNLPPSGSFAKEWTCKWDYIGASRLEQQEVYHKFFRQWHWRLGTEELAFSFFNHDGWMGPESPVPIHSSQPPNYLGITKQTLLVASDDDEWNEGQAQLFGNPITFNWENRWTRTRLMGSLMQNTPLQTLYLPNTGHSVHNERPTLLADQIANFVSGGGLRVTYDPNTTDETCSPQLGQFPDIPGALLENPASAKNLKQPAQLGGGFSDGSKDGAYSLRLAPELRQVAQAAASGADPAKILANAAVYYYNNNTTMGNAYADLTITGGQAYKDFQSHRPTEDSIGGWVANRHSMDSSQLLRAVQKARTRAYRVAWSLHNPNTQSAYKMRPLLGWIAVSGEDDSPTRPVNVPSGLPLLKANSGGFQIATYPQYDIQVNMCPSLAAPPYVPQECQPSDPGSVPIQIRYSIASSESAALATAQPPSAPIVVIAPGTQAGVFVATKPASALGTATQTTATATRPLTGATVSRPALTANAPAGGPTQIQMSVLSASACPTVDGRTCLLPGRPRPLIGGSRIMDLITVTSNGAPVTAAVVVVAGQNIEVQTNTSGIAVITHQPCVTRSNPPSAVACEATASKSGYQPFVFSLP